jgi:hypothetical protein
LASRIANRRSAGFLGRMFGVVRRLCFLANRMVPWRRHQPNNDYSPCHQSSPSTCHSSNATSSAMIFAPFGGGAQLAHHAKVSISPDDNLLQNMRSPYPAETAYFSSSSRRTILPRATGYPPAQRPRANGYSCSVAFFNASLRSRTMLDRMRRIALAYLYGRTHTCIMVKHRWAATPRSKASTSKCRSSHTPARGRGS